MPNLPIATLFVPVSTELGAVVERIRGRLRIVQKRSQPGAVFPRVHLLSRECTAHMQGTRAWLDVVFGMDAVDALRDGLRHVKFFEARACAEHSRTDPDVTDLNLVPGGGRAVRVALCLRGVVWDADTQEAAMPDMEVFLVVATALVKSAHEAQALLDTAMEGIVIPRVFAVDSSDLSVLKPYRHFVRGDHVDPDCNPFSVDAMLTP